MKNAPDFALALRRGKTGVSDHLLVHYFAGEEQEQPALVGVVVPKKQIKLASHRNLYKRRIRHIMSELLEQLPAGSRTVIRVRSKDENFSFSQMRAEIAKALGKAQEKTDKIQNFR